MTEYTSLF